MAIIGTNDTATVRVASLPSGVSFDAAANVAYTPTGSITETNVQSALAAIEVALSKGAITDLLSQAGKSLRVKADETGYELYEKNLFSFGANSSQEGAQGYLNHGVGAGDNVAKPENNSLLVIRGSDTAPDSDILYAKSAFFTELHTDAALSAAQSVWGNPYKVSAVTAEAIAHANSEIELCGASFRSYSTVAPGNLVDAAKGILVGMACIGQTNTGSGIASHNVWGANVIAAQTSGNSPQNVVGIEADVLNSSASAGLRPGTAGSTNFTAYWAQSDAAGGNISDAAFLVTHTATSGGWNYGLVGEIKCNSWLIWMKNTLNAPAAQGMRIETAWGASNHAVMELVNNGTTQMKVTGDVNYPIEIRVGSGAGNFRAIKVGAPDTAGTGFRILMVDN